MKARKLQKITKVLFTVSREKYTADKRAFYELFLSPLNDPLVCFVWFPSFNQYFESSTEDEKVGVQSILASGCMLASVYVGVKCFKSIWVYREEQQESGVQTLWSPH